MRKTIWYLASVLVSIMFVGCQTDTTEIEDGNALTISICNSRTSLGEKNGNSYPAYWSEGDQLVVNGTLSSVAQICEEEPSKATFFLDNSVEYPYYITYPYASSTTAQQPVVVFPAEQSYTKGTFENGSAPLCGYIAKKGDSATLQQLATILRIPIKGSDESTTLEKVVFTATDTQIAGEFKVDCHNKRIEATANTTNCVTYSVNQTLSTTNETVLYVSLPAVNLGDCRVELFDSKGNKMTVKWGNKELIAGAVREFKTLNYCTGIIGDLTSFEKQEDEFWDHSVTGYVKDNMGNPIAGVPVSDGFTITTTDSNGFYKILPSSDTWYIYISIPAEYEIPINEHGQPVFYQRYINEIYNYNFTLTPLAEGKEKKFALFVFGDPQVTNKTNLARFNNETVPSIKSHCTELINTGTPCYGITLGDIVSNGTSNNDESLRVDMRNSFAVSKTGMPVFQVMGNHDYTYCNSNSPALTDSRSSTLNLKMQRKHESIFGPVNYSFNRGDVHIIAMKNIYYRSNTNGGDYSYGFTDEQYEWLKQDLKLVPKNKAVVLCVHIHMLDRISRWFTDVKNRINDFNDVHIMSGHTHINRNYEHDVEGKNTSNIYEHNAGALCGAWWCSNLCGDGTPNGYQVFIGGNDETGGKLVNWYFIGCNEGMNTKSHQMRLYRGNATTGGDKSTSSKPESSVTGYYAFNYGEDVLLANIYNADSKWVVKVYEDGVHTGNMEKIETLTPSFSSLIGDYTMENPRRSADGELSSHDMYVAGLFLGILGRYSDTKGSMGSGSWSGCHHMYKYTLKNKDASIKVEATDRFGNVYTETTITEGTDYSLTK